MGIKKGRASWRNRLGGRRGPQRKGPLRRVVEVIRHATNLFDRDRVLLECGHETYSRGERARCSGCKTEQEATNES